MFFEYSIDGKGQFLKPNGDVVVNFISATFPEGMSFVGAQMFYIPKEYEMRPDLICLAIYKHAGYVDALLKYNDISNPFSIKAGDVISCPDMKALTQYADSVTSARNNSAAMIRASHKFIDPTLVPTERAALKKYDNRNLTNADIYIPAKLGINTDTTEGELGYTVDAAGNIVLPSDVDLLNGITTTGPNNVIVNPNDPFGIGINRDKIDPTPPNEYPDGTVPLPPNISQPGQSALTYRNGRVYFGEGVAPSCVKDGMTITDFNDALIRNNKTVL